MHTETHLAQWENKDGLTKMPEVKWIESMVLWEDRYVKGCCWQLLLLPWWLVPNDRPVEKGAFDNAAITIHRIPVTLHSIYIPPLCICCWHWCQVCATWGVLPAHVVNCILFPFCGLRIAVLKITYHLAHSNNRMQHKQIYKSPFFFVFLA